MKMEKEERSEVGGESTYETYKSLLGTIVFERRRKKYFNIHDICY